jgi:hypothetical protein
MPSLLVTYLCICISENYLEICIYTVSLALKLGTITSQRVITFKITGILYLDSQMNYLYTHIIILNYACQCFLQDTLVLLVARLYLYHKLAVDVDCLLHASHIQSTFRYYKLDYYINEYFFEICMEIPAVEFQCTLNI